MVRIGVSRFTGTSIEYSFDIFATDELETPRIDINASSNNNSGIYPNAIQNFEGMILGFGLDVGNNPGEIRIGQDENSDILNPITLDLVTQKSEITLENEDSPDPNFVGGTYSSIEYNFVGGELSAFGIYELSLILVDADANIENGFQIVIDTNSTSDPFQAIVDRDTNQEGFQFIPPGVTETTTIDSLEDEQLLEEAGLLVFEIDPDAAVNDIDYIVGDSDDLALSPFSFASFARLSGLNSNAESGDIDFNREVIELLTGSLTTTGDSLLIEAEDLNLDNSAYEVESNDIGEFIGLRNSSLAQGEDVTGEVSLIVGSDIDQVDITGDYNLTISTFDENDGAGTIDVLVNGERRGDLIILDENPNADNPDNDVPNEDIRREFTFGLGDLEAGDTIMIQGTSNEAEYTRLDFLVFEENL